MTDACAAILFYDHGLGWQTAAMQRMHVLDSDGRMVGCADAVVALWRPYTALSIAGKCGTTSGLHWCSEQGCSVFAHRPYKSRCNDVM